MFNDWVTKEMKLVFKDVPYGIEHTFRVLNNATEIMAVEKVDAGTEEIISLSALLHDIGAVEAQRKHGSMAGHFQELEGPHVARAILERASAPARLIERVCYIVGNHHTPAKIDGIDFQVLWEADFLDNLEFGERPATLQELQNKIRENFRTEPGKLLALKRCEAAFVGTR